jgi:hypothetical protein
MIANKMAETLDQDGNCRDTHSNDATSSLVPPRSTVVRNDVGRKQFGDTLIWYSGGSSSLGLGNGARTYRPIVPFPVGRNVQVQGTVNSNCEMSLLKLGSRSRERIDLESVVQVDDTRLGV